MTAVVIIVLLMAGVIVVCEAKFIDGVMMQLVVRLVGRLVGR